MLRGCWPGRTAAVVAVCLLAAGLAVSAPAAGAQAVAGAEAEADCEGGEPPSPTEVAVTAVPIVVESTAADYFVLYASFDVDGASVEYPVLAVRGQDGTTALSENVAPLPAERYRVEKYSVADPADVDGDCIDDITELANPAAMSPVNPAATRALAFGAVAVPDQATLETLAHAETANILHLKFTILNRDSDRPEVLFQNSNFFDHHRHFYRHFDIDWRADQSYKGSIIYDPELTAPDGSRGLFRYHTDGQRTTFSEAERIFTLLAAAMPVLDGNFALEMRNWELRNEQTRNELPLYRESRISVAFDDDIYRDGGFVSLNPGEGFGLLRHLAPDERPGSRDVVVYGALPNELPRVAGIITTVRQTPLSHVNLRAAQDRVPNAFIADALDDEAISGLLGSFVYYAVTDSGYVIRAATGAEVDEFYAASRPAQAQTPRRDLSVTEITALGDVGFGDWDAFGVKAANVAVLGTLGLGEGVVPEGFAVPFYFFDEFMKHNGLYDDVAEMLADPEFASDMDVRVKQLKALRKKIKKADTPEWIDTALEAMHATFPEGQSLRYRSSTNNEDLPGFNGAGLYDSKTQHPDETEEDGIAKSLKQVYASLWNYRAFAERDFHRVDHLATAMGVLVHPNYTDESVNGVAVSTDPAYGTADGYYVNAQVGEDLVTNPDAHSVPEETLLRPHGRHDTVALSNQVPPGDLLMTAAQLTLLRRHLTAIHQQFAQLYNPGPDERFAIEIEFKITSDNTLAIKQARPWIFTDPPDITTPTDTGSTLTATPHAVPATHDGSDFDFRVSFSEPIQFGVVRYRTLGFETTGGTVTRVARVSSRSDDWRITVQPDSAESDVTLAWAENRPCSIPGAVCTRKGVRLSSRLEVTVESRLPAVPARPVGWMLADSVGLRWGEVARADSFELQMLVDGEWADVPDGGVPDGGVPDGGVPDGGVPDGGVEAVFEGAGATVSGLGAGEGWSFRVRARNAHGVSGWSAAARVEARLVLDGELRAGVHGAVSPPLSGYSKFGDFGDSLTASSFEIDGLSYRVEYLLHLGGGLVLGLNRDLPSGFTLVVGDAVYAGSDSSVFPTYHGAGGYWWPTARPGWPDDGPVAVSLLTHPGAEPAQRPKAPVVGRFERFPAEHDGTAAFTLRVTFSEPVATAADAMRDHAITVTGGAVTQAAPVFGNTAIWEITVQPRRRAPVTIAVAPRPGCDDPAAVCSPDNRQLHSRIEHTVAAKPNHAPTGAPVVTGTPEPGGTLTVDASAIADADGMTTATLHYQWLQDNGSGYRPVPDATATTYTVAAADQGSAFKAQVTFTDDAGNPETLTSAAAASMKPYAVVATADTDGNVVITWQEPVAVRGRSAIYQILRRRLDTGETEPAVLAQFTFRHVDGHTDTQAEPAALYEYTVILLDYTGTPLSSSQPAQTQTPDNTHTDDTDDTDGGTDTGSDTGSDTDNTDNDNDDDTGGTPRSAEPPAEPLTAQLSNPPPRHDGNSPFTIELHFSEELALSYITLRDHAFTVTNGTITKARRLQPGSDTAWQITIQPDSDADITITLPPTHDCTSPQALCTPANNTLTQPPTLTIAGPTSN